MNGNAETSAMAGTQRRTFLTVLGSVMTFLLYLLGSCVPVRLDEVVPSIELLRHHLPVSPLHERHVRHRVAVLQRGKDADHAIAFVLLHRLGGGRVERRSEEHTSELQSRSDLVCRLLLEKKKRAATTSTLPRQVSAP